MELVQKVGVVRRKLPKNLDERWMHRVGDVPAMCFCQLPNVPQVQFLGNPLELSPPRRARNAPKTKTPQTQGLSHGALVEEPLLREAVSSAQLVPRPRFDRLLRLDELSWALLFSALAVSCPAEYELLLIALFQEPVCCTQHTVARDFVWFRKRMPLHVAWLLGCYGFSTIVLGACEDLVAENTRIKRASLDLLAYHPVRKLVLFGGCTLNVPKEEDYVKLLSVRSMLLEEWKGDVPFSCEAVMFSGVPDCPAKWNTSTAVDFMPFITGDRVTIIDANRLAEGIRFLQERNEEHFFGNLGFVGST